VPERDIYARLARPAGVRLWVNGRRTQVVRPAKRSSAPMGMTGDLPGLLAVVEHFVVCRALVEAGEHRLRPRRHLACLAGMAGQAPCGLPAPRPA